VGKKVLITGGAGFVGSHTADALIRKGHTVRIYDNLTEQVHAAGAAPAYLPPEAEFVRGDMRDLDTLSKAVRGVDVIYHLAAAIGVGQSMYEIAYYTAVNNQGTANLLQALLDSHVQQEKIIVASSMSIYGEGKYLCQECGPVAPPPRPAAQLREKRWETACPHCGPMKANRRNRRPFMRSQKKIKRKCCCFLAVPTEFQSLHCGTSIFTALGNRSRTPTPEWRQSSPRG